MRNTGESVGQIGLDLVVNEGGFRRQMAGIGSLAKKAGMALAAAFSVKKLIDFGRECLELGSDLAEVQNVVDVTFPSMTAQVDKFAKSAMTSFGLSETMAKQYTGTFGAMAKAFGYTEQAAYDMGTTLTGLAGDVASFYNISQDEAYTKLKSVFSGETETLKDLGVVMTQNALDAYALANGYGKTTAKMSELEKVSLRYAFVQDQLSAATGDFARTSDSWANQVRIMKLQMQSFMATVGQGLINVFSPVIKVINTVIGKLMTLANVFKAFTELVMGKKSAGAQVTGTGQAAADSLSGAAGAADNLADSTSSAGKAAKKAAKEMRALMGFDAVDKLSSSSSSDSSAGGSSTGGADGGFGAEEVAIPTADAAEEDSIYGNIKKTLQEITDIFNSGIKTGMGDWQNRLTDVQTKSDSIKNSLENIFSDPKVQSGASDFAQSVLYNFGVVVGSAGSIGLSIAQNLVGGIAGYLENNTERIKQYLVNMFDIGSNIADLTGKFSEAFAYIFEAFGSENGQLLTENLIGIFTDAGMGVTELCGKLAEDILNIIISPFVDNKEGFRTALEGFLGTAATVCGTIKTTIDQTFDKLLEVYDGHIKPFFDSIASGLSGLAGQFLEFWNTNVQPIMDELAQKFDSIMAEHIQPMLDKAIELLGSIVDALKTLWEQVLAPLVAWIIENVLPVLLPIIQNLYDGFMSFVGFIADAIAGLITVIKGIIDFVVGVFTGDWEKAWGGVSDIITGMMQIISSFIQAILTKIGTIIQIALNLIKGIFQTKFSAIRDFVKTVMSTVKTIITTLMGNIKGGITMVLGNIKKAWTNSWTSMKTTVTGIFKNIWSTIKGIINSILGGIEKMANGVVSGINTVIRALNNLSFTTPDWLPDGLGGKTFGFHIGELSRVNIPRLAQGGYVKPNTPQLAMIGDNRHQGEVVAPEDKLLEMAAQAARQAGNGGISSGELQTIIESAVTRIIAALYELGFNLDGEQLAKAEKIIKSGLDRRYNTVELV